MASKINWPFPIGECGKPWGAEEKAAWKAYVGNPKRSYQDEVLSKLTPLKEHFDVVQYGSLSYLDAAKFPLFSVRSRNWDSNKPNILVTGGVHGYETSGVQGAILFMQTKMLEYSKTFNIIVVPCVSPWGYETIQRWNANAVDPNRSFFPSSGCEEATSVLSLIESLGDDFKFLAHFDLHETTDTDESEFGPAKSARDGVDHVPDTIPDGFCLVGDTINPQAEWHAAMIESVRNVTHIAPPDSKGLICGEPITQEGVVVYPTKSIFLCSSSTNASYATTTEMYPDSPKATPEQCNQAQVACVTGGLDFLAKTLANG